MKTMLARVLAWAAPVLAMFAISMPAHAVFTLDLSALTDNIGVIQTSLVGLGIVILTLVYAVRAFAWGRKV